MIVSAQVLRQTASIVTLALHSQRQRLHAAQYRVCVPNTQHAADEFHCADQRVAIHLVARNGDAARRIGMPAEILGRAVYDDVGAELQRLAQVRSEERRAGKESRTRRTPDYIK